MKTIQYLCRHLFYTMMPIFLLFTASRHKRFLHGCLACFLLSGCLSTKDITYFQPKNTEWDAVATKILPYTMPVIKPGDVLSITIGALDKDDREIFNPIPNLATYQSYTTGFVVLQPIKGFTVDSLGYILFPQVGKIKVAGLTAKEVELILYDQLQEHVQLPTVSVTIANFIISILGEVARPSQYVISHNRITLPEALALAGDLTIFGNRKTVSIIRERDGQRIFAQVDLTNRMLFRSPYYHLQAGDMIYVEPTKGRLTATDRAYQITPVVLSSISIILLIVNSVIK